MFNNFVFTIITVLKKTLTVPAFAYDACQVNWTVDYARGVHYYDGGCGGCGCEDTE